MMLDYCCDGSHSLHMTHHTTFDFRSIHAATVTVDGVKYVISSGTGERSYGSSLGGDAAFAYFADDVGGVRESYQDFCDAISPVGPDHTSWRAIAEACAAKGLRLTAAGGCSPALDDAAYLAVAP